MIRSVYVGITGEHIQASTIAAVSVWPKTTRRSTNRISRM